jgi:uncharacterized phiE125 gp8 family phage protein
MYRNYDFSDHGRAVLITPPDPANPAVTLADAKIGLGISDASQDTIVAAAIAVASDALDPAAGGWLGRALRTQTWELQLRSFAQHRQQFFVSPRHPPQAHKIVLPFPPLGTVVSVTYTDVNGVAQALVQGTDFRILGAGQVYGKAMIAPLYAGSWPLARLDDGSVRIRFTCGYVDAAPAMAMPHTIKQAIILGARALMSVTARDMLLMEDRVEGLGWKRFQNNPAAADVVNKAIQGLLINMAIS